MDRPDASVESPVAASREMHLERAVLAVCDAVGQFIEWWGFKAILGRIWVLLVLRGRPMSQSAIAKQLQVSRSLVSMAVSELSDLGLLQAVGGHHHAPYQATIDVWPAISQVLRSREWMLLESARSTLEAAVQQAELLQREGCPVGYDLPRMQLLLRMTELAQSMLRLLITLGGSHVPAGFSGWLSRAAELTRTLRRQRCS